MVVIRFILLAICVILASGANDWDPRIVGGEDAKIKQFLYQVSLREEFSRSHFCGGSILSNRLLLTAAQCTDGKDPDEIYAVFGTIDRSFGGVVHELEKIIQHSEWDRSESKNDIALICTVKEITFTDFVQPIALPKQNMPTEGNIQVVLSGWGRTSNPGELPAILQFTKSHTLSTKDCRNRFNGTAFQRYISESIVCTTAENDGVACDQDSGGPLVDMTDPNNKQLVGIISWKVPCASGYPDIHTRVYSYLDWIHEHTKESTNDSVERY